jgi:hypothetical protein
VTVSSLFLFVDVTFEESYSVEEESGGLDGPCLFVLEPERMVTMDRHFIFSVCLINGVEESRCVAVEKNFRRTCVLS